MSENLPNKITGLQALAIVFIAVIAIEVGLSTVNTYNYDQFYKALAQLQVKLADFQVVRQSGNNSAVTTTFSVMNPTGYTSMVMRDFSFSFTLNNSTDNTQIAGTSAVPGTSPYLALDPSVVQNVTNSFPMPNLPAKNYIFLFTVTIDLSTFLDSLGTFQSKFACSDGQPGQPQSCAIGTINLLGAGLAGGGGGGGGL